MAGVVVEVATVGVLLETRVGVIVGSAVWVGGTVADAVEAGGAAGVVVSNGIRADLHALVIKQAVSGTSHR